MREHGYFEILCKYLVSGLTIKERSKTDKEIASKIKELEKISDKIAYFENIKNLKLKYLKELEKITILLNNKDLMRKEYITRNSKVESAKRIATIGIYKKMLENRKEVVVNKISELTASMNPINYMNKKRELEKYIEINSNNLQNKEEILIKLQETFITLLKDNCYETDNVQGLKDLIFKIRYYRFLYLTDKEQIRDNETLNNQINVVLKQAIQKLVANEVIRKIANDDELNQEIISLILDTKIIDLMAIRFEIAIKDDCIRVKTYEREVFEKEFDIKGQFSKKSFDIKSGKIYKLFM